MNRTYLIFIFSFVFLFLGRFVFAENIDPDSLGNDFAILEFDDSQISFDCTYCNVDVTDTEITGYAWGESVGWINLQPGSSGVVNDGDGNLSGYAWGENTGWINFDPTFGGVSIVNGEFDGYAWSENYGWIQFDCGVSGACVSTSWGAVPSEDDDGPGSGFGNVVYGCMNSFALNYNPNATQSDGSCIFPADAISGCTVSEAINYNPNAAIDDNSCQFGEIEIPDNPDDNTPQDPGNPTDNTPQDPGSDTTGGDGSLPGDNTEDTGGNNINIPLYTFSKIDVGPFAKILPMLLLLGSLLTIPFQQLLQVPVRAAQLVLSWFGVGKKKTWGIVFDSITKQPLDPVIVSLKDAQGKIVQTSITDMEGRYGFIAAPGFYSLEAHKADYVFPSEKLTGKISDGVYEELYFGGIFQVLEEGEIITKNIPLDAVNFNWNEYEKARLGLSKSFSQKIQKYSTLIFVLGFILSIVAVFILPIIWNYIVLGLYIVMGILQALGLPRHSGSVFTKDGQPLSFGIMRVYSVTLQKEMKKVVLDNLGNYYCLIRSGEYYVTFESRNPDGTYTPVYKSESFFARSGSIRKKFTI